VHAIDDNGKANKKMPDDWQFLLKLILSFSDVIPNLIGNPD